MTGSSRFSPDMRRLVPAVLTGVLIAGVSALGAAWWSRLPEPSATHWGPSGVADGHGPRWLLVLLPVLAIGGVTILGLGGGRRGIRAVWQTGLAPLVATTVGTTTVLALQANLDAPSWRDAGRVHVPIVLVAVVVGVLVGGAVQRLVLSTDRGAARTIGRAPIPIDPTDARVVTATVRVFWALALGAGLALAGALVIAKGGAGTVGTGVTLLIAGLLTATFSSVTVRADSRGLDVRVGPLGLPRVFLPLEEIDAAESIPDLEPLRWGGWGYRGSLSLFGSAAVVLRRGEALVLQLSRNRRFVVTTSNSEQAAQLLNDLIRRS